MEHTSNPFKGEGWSAILAGNTTTLAGRIDSSLKTEENNGLDNRLNPA